MTVTFEIEGQEFVALNGGPLFKFTEAVSFMVKCNSQAEIDEMWSKLSEGGEEGPCDTHAMKPKQALSLHHAVAAPANLPSPCWVSCSRLTP